MNRPHEAFLTVSSTVTMPQCLRMEQQDVERHTPLLEVRNSQVLSSSPCKSFLSVSKRDLGKSPPK